MAHADTSVDTLNSILRNEDSAVEAYRRALDAIRDDLARRTLEDCLHDHEARVEALRQRIEKLGGRPDESNVQPWDMGGANEEKACVHALAQGEDHGLHDYENDVARLHGEARRFLRMELLPRQKRTLERLSRLERTLH